MSVSIATEQAWDDPSPRILRRRRRFTPPPVPLTPLIGRGGEVAAACAALRSDDVRLLTLTGAGGIGKTRLALGIVAGLNGKPDRPPDFPDGVAWISLATVREPDAVAGAIARGIGAVDAASDSPTEAIKSSLRDARALLVLDNFEHVLDAAPCVSELLGACPALKVLVTSRSLLRIGGEHALPTPPLSFLDGGEEGSDAVQLFVARARALSGTFILDGATAPVVADICQRLDGLPLAIELAASRVDHLPLTVLRDRIGEWLLQARGARDLPDRQRTLGAAIAWSYDLLTPDQQAFFRRLAVFSGGFTLDAADAVATDRAEESGATTGIDALVTLVDMSLVRLERMGDGDSRYGILRTIQEFAAARLAASGEDAEARARHAAFFLDRVEQVAGDRRGSERASWLTRQASELANLRAATRWSLEQGMADPVLRLVTAMETLYWSARSDPGEGLRWLEAALAIGGTPVVRLEAVLVASGLAALRGDLARAQAFGEEALAWGDTLGRPREVARALVCIGKAAEWRGDLGGATERYGAALAAFRRLDDPYWVALMLNNLAAMALGRGDIAGAGILANEALERWRRESDVWGIALALGTLGGVAQAGGDRARAVGCYLEALDLGVGLDDRRSIASTLMGIAGVTASRGRLEAAARLLGAATAIRDALGSAHLPHDFRYADLLRTVRSGLSPAAFTAAWEAGLAWTLEEAIAATAIEVTAGDDQPSPPGAAAPAGAPHLSPREHEVLRLLVRGLSDRVIADALFVGERTVNSHVGKIYTKLGVRTRAAAVSAAMAAGLVDGSPDGPSPG